jgi:hypothetical protein
VVGCLRRHITKEAQYYLTLYGLHRDGVMEYAGGGADQEQRYLTAMNVIGRIYHQWELDYGKRGK